MCRKFITAHPVLAFIMVMESNRKNNRREITAITAEIICGCIFILSGVMKSLDSDAFARILGDYGIPGLEYTAPLIIVAEAIVGAALILRVYPRVSAYAAAVMLVVFSLGYAYGLIFRDVTDCGCFGTSELFSLPPALVFVRNVLLFVLLGVIIAFDKAGFRPHAAVALAAIAAVVSFACGRSFRHIHSGKNSPVVSGSRPVSETPLAGFVEFHPDSTYLVFVFSYTCPHCLNSIANLNLYESNGAVDRVIAIAHGSGRQEQEFRRDFIPRFRLITDSRVASGITSRFPMAFYVAHDSLIVDFSGELPCPQVFKTVLSL